MARLLGGGNANAFWHSQGVQETLKLSSFFSVVKDMPEPWHLEQVRRSAGLFMMTEV
jgi:hypothetical protein